MEGQYLGPVLSIWPEYIGARLRFARMTSCVRRVVRVMWQTVWGVVIDLVRNEKGTGGSSPFCTASWLQSIVVPSRRGGVPVLSLPIARPMPYSLSDNPKLGGSTEFSPIAALPPEARPAGIFFSP